ncbi:MAG: hypothetical protein AAGA32_06730 [Pseudomonadota bacterium]
MSADRRARLRWLEGDPKEVELQRGDRHEIALAVAGSVARFECEYIPNGPVAIAVDLESAQRWEEGPAAGAPIDAEERAALGRMLRRKLDELGLASDLF